MKFQALHTLYKAVCLGVLTEMPGLIIPHASQDAHAHEYLMYQLNRPGHWILESLVGLQGRDFVDSLILAPWISAAAYSLLWLCIFGLIGTRRSARRPQVTSPSDGACA